MILPPQQHLFNRGWRRFNQSKHEVYDKLQESEDFVNISYPVLFIDTNKYEKTEELLIKSLRIKLNIQHNRSKKI